MIRKLLFFVAVGLCAVPAGMASGGSNPSAQAQCVKLRASMGVTAFAAAYSTFGGCVSKLAPVDQGNQSTAQASCSAQEADANFAASHDGKTFDQFYGTGAKGKNAFGNCVSASARASTNAEVSATPNPARTCAAARTAMGVAAFKNLYGTNANKSNAFGKCVSKTAKSQTTNEVNASVTCRSDASVTAPTAAANAFGKCVASTAQATSTSQQQATINAAHVCEAALLQSRSQFRAKYATFGACVSVKVKAA
jgi:hypothetical protein